MAKGRPEGPSIVKEVVRGLSQAVEQGQQNLRENNQTLSDPAIKADQSEALNKQINMAAIIGGVALTVLAKFFGISFWLAIFTFAALILCYGFYQKSYGKKLKVILVLLLVGFSLLAPGYGYAQASGSTTSTSSSSSDNLTAEERQEFQQLYAKYLRSQNEGGERLSNEEMQQLQYFYQNISDEEREQRNALIDETFEGYNEDREQADANGGSWTDAVLDVSNDVLDFTCPGCKLLGATKKGINKVLSGDAKGTVSFDDAVIEAARRFFYSEECYSCAIIGYVFTVSKDIRVFLFNLTADLFADLIAYALALWLLFQGAKIMLPFAGGNEAGLIGEAFRRLSVGLIVILILAVPSDHNEEGIFLEYFASPVLNSGLNLGIVTMEATSSLIADGGSGFCDGMGVSLGGVVLNSSKLTPEEVEIYNGLYCYVYGASKIYGQAIVIGLRMMTRFVEQNFVIFEDSGLLSGALGAASGVAGGAFFEVAAFAQNASKGFLMVIIALLIGLPIILLYFLLFLFFLLAIINLLITYTFVIALAPALIASFVFPIFRQAFKAGLVTVFNIAVEFWMYAIVLVFGLAITSKIIALSVMTIPTVTLTGQESPFEVFNILNNYTSSTNLNLEVMVFLAVALILGGFFTMFSFKYAKQLAKQLTGGGFETNTAGSSALMTPVKTVTAATAATVSLATGAITGGASALAIGGMKKALNLKKGRDDPGGPMEGGTPSAPRPRPGPTGGGGSDGAGGTFKAKGGAGGDGGKGGRPNVQTEQGKDGKSGEKGEDVNLKSGPSTGTGSGTADKKPGAMGKVAQAKSDYAEQQKAAVGSSDKVDLQSGSTAAPKPTAEQQLAAAAEKARENQPATVQQGLQAAVEKAKEKQGQGSAPSTKVADKPSDAGLRIPGLSESKGSGGSVPPKPPETASGSPAAAPGSAPTKTTVEELTGGAPSSGGQPVEQKEVVLKDGGNPKGSDGKPAEKKEIITDLRTKPPKDPPKKS